YHPSTPHHRPMVLRNKVLPYTFHREHRSGKPTDPSHTGRSEITTNRPPLLSDRRHAVGWQRWKKYHHSYPPTTRIPILLLWRKAGLQANFVRTHPYRTTLHYSRDRDTAALPPLLIRLKRCLAFEQNSDFVAS